jgi:hypothetical protein
MEDREMKKRVIQITDAFSGPFENHTVKDPAKVDDQVRELLDGWMEGDDRLSCTDHGEWLRWDIFTAGGALDIYATCRK